MRGDESMRPLSLTGGGEAVALVDPALAEYSSSTATAGAGAGAGQHHSASKAPLSRGGEACYPWGQAQDYAAAGLQEEGDLGQDHDFTMHTDRRDDSSDNVNQGTPTKRRGSEGGGQDTSGSSKSTPSSGGEDTYNDDSAAYVYDPRYGEGSVSNMSSMYDGYSRNVNDSRATGTDYDPYLKAVDETACASDADADCSKSGSGTGRGLDQHQHVIKMLDFGASVDYYHDDLSIVDDDKDISKDKNKFSGKARLETPPRSAAAAIAHQPALASPSGLPGSTRAGAGAVLKPPSASSPASPELSGHVSTFGRTTPSRIPLPSSRGAHSGTRVSPTQERSTSKFADALRRHGGEVDADGFADVAPPMSLSKTVGGLQGQGQGLPGGRAVSTPQAKAAGQLVLGTPATLTNGGKPPTPAPTPMQLPQSRHAAAAGAGAAVDAFPFSGRAQRAEMSAYTEGFDEWKEAWTPVGKKYYYNRRTRKSGWRLPLSALHVKVPGEPDKIFVPHDHDHDRESGVATGSSSRHTAAAAGAGAGAVPDILVTVEDERVHTAAAKPANGVSKENEVDLLAATLKTSAGDATTTTTTATTTTTGSGSRAASPADWGGRRQVFKAEKADSAQAHSVALKAVQQADKQADTQQAAAGGGGGEEAAVPKQVLWGIKCKTLLFCPLCADVVLPQRFGSHFTECPEIAALTANGEFNIVINALYEGFASFSKEISGAVAAGAAQGAAQPRSQPPSRFQAGARPDASPMPSRVLDFGGAHENDDDDDAHGNHLSTPAAEATLRHGQGQGQGHAGERSRSQGHGEGLGNTVAHNKCAFCGKPSSKSALSAHLLVCKSRKQMQLKRQTAMQNTTNTTPLPRGLASAGKTRPAVTHRRAGSSSGTPQRRNRTGAGAGGTAPAKLHGGGGGEEDGAAASPAIWGSSTPDDNRPAVGPAPASSGKQQHGQYISPAGISDAINSAARGNGNKDSGRGGENQPPHYASPLKGSGGGAGRLVKQPLGDRSNAIDTPTRAIATRVFM
jgi:hypothetical protein